MVIFKKKGGDKNWTKREPRTIPRGSGIFSVPSMLNRNGALAMNWWHKWDEQRLRGKKVDRLPGVQACKVASERLDWGMGSGHLDTEEEMRHLQQGFEHSKNLSGAG